MPQPHPSVEPSTEQLVSALTGILDPNSRHRRDLLKLKTWEIFAVERDLSETSQVVRTIRNARTPINRLPPELLFVILSHYRDCGQDLVVATHICKYWRSTLISRPFLWNSLRLRSVRDFDRALTYLERSQSVVIHVRIALDSLPSLDSLQHFAPHIPRTRSLVIEGPFDVHTASSLLLCNPAPSLEHLEMRGNEDHVRPLDNFLDQQAPSLRSAVFVGICPVLESPFPFPSLNQLDLDLLENMGPIHMNSLFGLCSSCPRLQKIYIKISCEIVQDVPLDQITPMNSLVELEYTCDTPSQFLPFLELPLLKQLTVSSPWYPGTVDKLADLLPRSGHDLLSGATTVSYLDDRNVQLVELSGEGVNASLTMSDNSRAGRPPPEWSLDETYIPFGKVEALEFEGYRIPPDFSVDLLQNVKKLRVTPWAEPFLTEKAFQLLYPDPGTDVPCPSLREIEYTPLSPTGPAVESLVSLVKARKQAERQLELVCVRGTVELDLDLKEELREHVGELRVR